MSELSKLEYALLCAARAFAACYQDSIEKIEPRATHQPKKAPTKENNGIPYCEAHGKYHAKSKSGPGYYCVQCYIDKKNAAN